MRYGSKGSGAILKIWRVIKIDWEANKEGQTGVGGVGGNREGGDLMLVQYRGGSGTWGGKCDAFE